MFTWFLKREINRELFQALWYACFCNVFKSNWFIDIHLHIDTSHSNTHAQHYSNVKERKEQKERRRERAIYKRPTNKAIIIINNDLHMVLCVVDCWAHVEIRFHSILYVNTDFSISSRTKLFSFFSSFFILSVYMLKDVEY